MANHVHLLVQLTEANLARGMQHLHGMYGSDFNSRHGRVGHLFQGRYGVTVVRDEAHFLATVRYIALNPLAAGLCESADAWAWGSHAPLVSGTWPTWLDADELFAALDLSGDDRRARYRSFIEAA